MTKIFARAWQKFVKSVVLYADRSNNLYYDRNIADDPATGAYVAYSNPVPAKELKELYNKGLVIVDTSDLLDDSIDGPFISPISLSISYGTATLLYISGSEDEVVSPDSIGAFHAYDPAE